MSPPKITVSLPTYNEIAGALEQLGLKLGENVGTLTIEKGSEFARPIDFRLATVRKDAVTIAAQIWKDQIKISPNNVTAANAFIEYAEQIYNYILLHTKPERATPVKKVQLENNSTNPQTKW